MTKFSHVTFVIRHELHSASTCSETQITDPLALAAKPIVRLRVLCEGATDLRVGIVHQNIMMTGRIVRIGIVPIAIVSICSKQQLWSNQRWREKTVRCHDLSLDTACIPHRVAWLLAEP